MLELRDVVSGYGTNVILHGISLKVDQGELVALIGSNGAGKTTTIKSIDGLLRPSGGSIRFAGQEISGLTPDRIVRLGIATVPEGRRIFPSLTVAENLRLGSYTMRDRATFNRNLERVMNLFPRLQERYNQLGGTLSGGEQQMLAFGRALMAGPKLLLLDEPSMGLAPLVIQEMLQTVRKLTQEGITVLIVEQNARAALRIAHRAYVLETGRIGLEGTAADLLSNPKVQRAYLGVA